MKEDKTSLQRKQKKLINNKLDTNTSLYNKNVIKFNLLFLLFLHKIKFLKR